MMRFFRHTLLLTAVVLASQPLRAAEDDRPAAAPDTVGAGRVEHVVTVGAATSVDVPVGSWQRTTLKRHPRKGSRRIDREINKNKFVFRGETMLGLTASYGTVTSEDADMFPVFDGINLSGAVASVNPFIGYFYKDNRCIGLRFGYSHLRGTLDSFGVNLGPANDLELDIPWIDLSSNRFSVGLFHRSYVALDERGRFGVFGEAELSYLSGENTFAYKMGESTKHTESNTTTLRVLFSPGVAVYAFPNVCMSLSFGLGGFRYTSVHQYDDMGVETGSRQYSKLNFRLNLADIRIGMTIHLWNKKRDRKIESR